MSEPVKVVEDCHKLLVWLIPLLDQFPRNRRFTLGAHIEANLILVLEALVEASYTPAKSRAKKASLSMASNKLNSIRHLWRASYELKVISIKRYEFGAKQLTEIGAQVGGWLRR